MRDIIWDCKLTQDERIQLCEIAGISTGNASFFLEGHSPNLEEQTIFNQLENGHRSKYVS